LPQQELYEPFHVTKIQLLRFWISFGKERCLINRHTSIRLFESDSQRKPLRWRVLNSLAKRAIPKRCRDKLRVQRRRAFRVNRHGKL
jgi:hypothetical protein